MIELSGLVTIAITFFIAAASPGPAVIALMAVSMDRGRRAALTFSIGLTVGIAVWGLVAATGLGAILSASYWALFAMKIFGGLYLLWLAYQSWRSAMQANAARLDVDRKQVVKAHLCRNGLILNLSNPKAVVAWMSVLALGMGEGSGPEQVIAATIMCIALTLIIYVIYAFVFSTGSAMGFYRKSRRSIEATVAGLFAIAGLGLMRSAFVKP